MLNYLHQVMSLYLYNNFGYATFFSLKILIKLCPSSLQFIIKFFYTFPDDFKVSCLLKYFISLVKDFIRSAHNEKKKSFLYGNFPADSSQCKCQYESFKHKLLIKFLHS